jgi:hypothetical protein
MYIYHLAVFHLEIEMRELCSIWLGTFFARTTHQYQKKVGKTPTPRPHLFHRA